MAKKAAKKRASRKRVSKERVIEKEIVAKDIKAIRKELLKRICTYDRNLQSPPQGHASLHGLETIWDASVYSGIDSHYFELEVNLGIEFSEEPTVQLTQKLIHDELGNVYDSGNHDISYRWIDCSTYKSFKICLYSHRLNYPPVISYLVTGRIGQP